MWKRLNDVKNKKVDFIDPDMSMLANTLELYYKGMLEASGLEINDHLLNETHNLYTLYSEINYLNKQEQSNGNLDIS